MRIKLSIEYDGTKFFGWQKQIDFISVQETIEKAIFKVLGEEEIVELYGAGRTDTGVHATSQVAHFEIKSERLIDKWKNNCHKLPLAINFYLADSGTCITHAEIAPFEDFHARFSAKMRHYRYVIYNRYIDSVLQKNRSWHISKRLDENKMHEAAQYFIGTHNLNAFRSVHCNAKNPIRSIDSINVIRENDFVIVELSARSFLQNQVRITVGTLKQIGEGKQPPEYIKFLLDNPDRKLAGETAPPYGLYLTGVEY